ncbi:MAG: hypothetical protein WA628_25390 [Terriglobales bacterium]
MADASQPPQEQVRTAIGEPGACVEYSIDPEKALVLVRMASKISARDIENYAKALRTDPLFVPAFSEIVDLRAVEEVEITPAEAIALADRVDPFAPSSRRAFVAINDYQANSARMHQMLRSPAKSIAIFTTMEAAERWIRSADPKSAPGSTGRVLPFAPRSRP